MARVCATLSLKTNACARHRFPLTCPFRKLYPPSVNRRIGRCSASWGICSGASLETEILTLRHQLNVLRRKAPKRLVFSKIDRLVFASLYRLIPGILNTLVIVKPETVIPGIGPGFACSAMEVALSRRQTEGPARNPEYEPCQPALGCASDPWRTPQTRY